MTRPINLDLDHITINLTPMGKYNLRNNNRLNWMHLSENIGILNACLTIYFRLFHTTKFDINTFFASVARYNFLILTCFYTFMVHEGKYVKSFMWTLNFKLSNIVANLHAFFFIMFGIVLYFKQCT